MFPQKYLARKELNDRSCFPISFQYDIFKPRHYSSLVDSGDSFTGRWNRP